MPSIPYDSQRVALYQPATRPTLFAEGVHYSHEQLGVEAARLAYLKAERSGPDLQLLTQALARVGFDPPQPFNHVGTGTQGFGAYRPADRLALVAFRGTQPEEVIDLFTDLNAWPTPWTESAGRVHQGFAKAARAVAPQVGAWLDGAGGQRRGLLLCGHSLGAALATLAATIWRPTLLLTLGCPRVGDSDFTRTLADVDATRLVNCCDLVTQLPPAIPWYAHLGPDIYIDRDGRRAGTPDAGAVLADRNLARLAYAPEALQPGAVLTRDLADHAPINYLRALWP